ncbi:hypothetical protein M419DRAFT_91632 [Trichoderma reesei RUT C-30]|jgi:hypothetical protein|uniref:Glycosyltransferase family 1 n=1 Tax=Hypocrea jecorina (strain ATCC 56765 / BCRC 32924 / NRRL 11460 / Rut C-30) TaxID=1344414 RepID=A0A024RZR8_HYPJR|nr:hypothetical protein M419DRAFT_91632 [Trichoderma reesei RUT C-30]
MLKMVFTAYYRRLRSFYLFIILLAVALLILSSRESTRSLLLGEDPIWQNLFTTDDDLLWWNDRFPCERHEPIRIAIVESAGVHDEVTAALVYAFGGHPNAELRLYFARQRYQSDVIINNLELQTPILSVNSSNYFKRDVANLPPPHFVVSTTCELDLEKPESVVAPLRHLLFNETTHLFCLVHHADYWNEGKHVDVVREWVDQERVDFIGLSQHTVDYLLQKSVTQWPNLQASVTARTFPPVFPVNQTHNETIREVSLAMQGDYAPERRDYKRIFGSLDNVVKKINGSAATTGHQTEESVKLHLIGHGPHVEVPENIRGNVAFDEDLSYPDFYRLLSQSYAVIPAFASETYLDRKASSTVPASLIAGVPLVASEKLLASYSYLPREAVWLSEPDEREMETVERVVGDRETFMEKKKKVKEAAENIMKQNRMNVRRWMNEDFTRRGIVPEDAVST